MTWLVVILGVLLMLSVIFNLWQIKIGSRCVNVAAFRETTLRHLGKFKDSYWRIKAFERGPSFQDMV